ncbi:flagellar hook-length control protein FliK [Shinella pollutisoli]|uniref:Flagellar hook-length control protein FliK n=1 Tax=Shinella pollutisoli TaxID=2250594 RepID=A0ABV7DDY4_9HYPH|nr:flagellar hook-length control protein FliK [Shinella pollutisoli]
MSNIASGIAGLGQRAAPAKGQGGVAGMAGASSDGEGFASAIASVSARSGGHGRKSLPVDIAGDERFAADAANPAARVKLARIPDAVRKPEPGVAEASPDAKSLAAAASAKGATSHGVGRREDRTDETAEEEVPIEGAEVGEAPQAAADTDVGNLLAMLAARGGPQDAGTPVAARDGGRKSGRQDVQADAVGKRAEAGVRPENAGQAAAQDLPETDTPPSDADQLFRLVRSDGKGKDVDIRISADGERTALKDANPTGPKGETVTVVDARRYIGLAQSGNSGAVTAAIAQDPEWASSLSATGDLMRSHAGTTGGVVNTLKIQMNPVELGMVTATLRLHGDELVVSLQVETGEAYRQLSDDQDAIVKALRGHGFAVDQVSVQLAPVDRSASSQQQGDGQFQQQFSSQPQAREGDGGRRDGAGQGGDNLAGEGSTHEDSTADGASGASGNQSLRTGGVYL